MNSQPTRLAAQLAKTTWVILAKSTLRSFRALLQDGDRFLNGCTLVAGQHHLQVTECVDHVQKHKQSMNGRSSHSAAADTIGVVNAP